MLLAFLQVLDAKSKAEEAAATSAAALSAAERKAKAYRGDSTALLSDYDAWVQSLLAKKSSSGSGGAGAANTPAGAVRGSTSMVHSGNGAAVDMGSWAGGLQSPVREGGLSRNTSQLGLASPGLSSPGIAAGQQRDTDLERYDRIAALLENRGVSASLTRALSGKSLALSPSTLAVGAASPAPAGRASVSSSRAHSGRLSPRPVFK